ncbi:MAG: hypothetical protein V9G13_10755 [Marmoricola sp.]
MPFAPPAAPQPALEVIGFPAVASVPATPACAVTEPPLIVTAPPVTCTPYALEPAPVGVPESMMLFFNTGLPAVTSTPAVSVPPGPVIVMFAIVPLAEASTPPLTVVVPPTPPVTVRPGCRVKPA